MGVGRHAHADVGRAARARDYLRTLASGFAYGYRRLGIPVEILVRV